MEEIGSGSFGVTYLIKDINLDKSFVLKEFSSGMIDEKKNEQFFKKFIKEIKILFDLHHQNIVNIYDYSINQNKQTGYYIMEYINGNNICDYIKKNKSQLNEIFLQVINVFSYLEYCDICHRDVRINNIMITKTGIVKLIDFGFVKNIAESNSVNSATQLIKYPYEWPEELKDKDSKYDIKTEIYFIGKLFLDLIDKMASDNFKYKTQLYEMTNFSYDERISSFNEILESLHSDMITN